MIILINEHILQTQIMAFHPKLLTTIAIATSTVYPDTQPLHDLYPPLHLLPHTLNPSLHMSNQKRAPLHAPVISIHDIPRPFPLFLALLQVPLVALVALVSRDGRQPTMSGRAYLVRIEMKLVRRRFPLVLANDAVDLTLRTRNQVRLGRRPRSAIDLVRMREFAPIGPEKSPRNDRTDMD